MALKAEIGKTGGGILDGLGAGDAIAGFGIDGGVEKVIALEVTDEDVVQIAIVEVGAFELSEVDDELSSSNEIAADFEVA